jgi:hypothetical protein
MKSSLASIAKTPLPRATYQGSYPLIGRRLQKRGIQWTLFGERHLERTPSATSPECKLLANSHPVVIPCHHALKSLGYEVLITHATPEPDLRRMASRARMRIDNSF